MPATPSRWTQLSVSERRVALEVLVHGPLARTELAQRLELSTPSLTRLTKPLIDTGVLHEVDDPTDPAARTAAVRCSRSTSTPGWTTSSASS